VKRASTCMEESCVWVGAVPAPAKEADVSEFEGPTRKDVELTVRLVFEGDYYEARELVALATRWMKSGLDDRSDLREISITGKVLRETEITS